MKYYQTGQIEVGPRADFHQVGTLDMEWLNFEIHLINREVIIVIVTHVSTKMSNKYENIKFSIVMQSYWHIELSPLWRALIKSQPDADCAILKECVIVAQSGFFFFFRVAQSGWVFAEALLLAHNIIFHGLSLKVVWSFLRSLHFYLHEYDATLSGRNPQ